MLIAAADFSVRSPLTEGQAPMPKFGANAGASAVTKHFNPFAERKGDYELAFRKFSFPLKFSTIRAVNIPATTTLIRYLRLADSSEASSITTATTVR